MEGGGGKKGGQRLLGEGLEGSGVCSVHEETGQGVRLRNSLQWLSQSHVDHHVLPPPPSVRSLLPLCSVYRILSARLVRALCPPPV